MLSSFIDKKYFKFIIIFLVILILLVTLRFILGKKTPDKITDYVISVGYQKDENGLYVKENSNITKAEYDLLVNLNKDANYSVNTFDLYNYELTKDEYEYKNKVSMSLIQTYNYKDRSLIYTYRINGEDMNVLYMGDYYYETDEFTCSKELSYGVTLSDTEQVICNRIKLSVLNFALEAGTFFKNAEFDNYIRNNADSYQVQTETEGKIETE